MSGSLFQHYLDETLPNYVQQKLSETLSQLQHNQCLIDCAHSICEIIELSRKLQNRLHAQKQLIFIAHLLEQQIYPIKDAEKNNTYMLSIQDVYAFQIFLRLLCIMIQFESKVECIDYKDKYTNDFVKGFLMLKTIHAYNLDQQFIELCQKMRSTSIFFYKYVIKQSNQFQLKNCSQHFRNLCLGLKKKHFSKQTQSQIEVKQESKGECSNSCFDQLDLRIRDKRLQMMMNVKQSKPDYQNISFQDAFKCKENQKILNTTDSTVSRPSLCKRTINVGINGKYKLGNEIKVIRKTTSSNKKKKYETPLQNIYQQQQLKFCQEVSQKLLQLEERRTISWTSEYLAPETESDSGFN